MGPFGWSKPLLIKGNQDFSINKIKNSYARIKRLKVLVWKQIFYKNGLLDIFFDKQFYLSR